MAASTYRLNYTTLESVKVRLAGKVAFQNSERITNQRVMPDELLGQLVSDAETAVEQDLRGRYKIPFQSIENQTWLGLPDHTRRAVRTIVDQMAVVMVLRESFGAGTHITGEGYLKNATEQYEALLRRLLGQDMINNEFGERRFKRTPPLDDLALAACNVADDGFFGAVQDANPRTGYERETNFAANQINDPSAGIFWFGGRYRGPR